MKRFFLVVSSVVLMALCVPHITADAANVPDISAKAAVVISADTGEIVYAENADAKLPMASTTKIMTTLLCIESGGLDEEFVVDSDAIRAEGSSMGLQEGDIVTKYALCCGMLLPSGNDAANAAAVRIAGSIDAFADMMNERAQELGMSHTYFVTPSGLEGEGHGSSAYDMALLAREALKNDTFRSICSCTDKRVCFGNPPYNRYLKNTNKLLTMYDGVYGVKTGFTDEAGRCLVSACERNGLDLICVTLNDRNDWNDHMALYDYAFQTAKQLTVTAPTNLIADVAGSDKECVALCTDGEPINITVVGLNESDIGFEVISPPFIYAPVMSGDAAAELSISANGREIRRIPLYAAENAEYIHKTKKQKRRSAKFTEKLKRLIF